MNMTLEKWNVSKDVTQVKTSITNFGELLWIEQLGNSILLEQAKHKLICKWSQVGVCIRLKSNRVDHHMRINVRHQMIQAQSDMQRAKHNGFATM